MDEATKLGLRWLLGFDMTPISRITAEAYCERAYRWLQFHETTLHRVARLVCAMGRAAKE